MVGKRLRLFSLSRAFGRTTGGSADGNGTATVKTSAKKRPRKFFSSNKSKSSNIYDNLSVDSGFVRKLEDDLDSKFNESEASPSDYTYTDWSESEADFDHASTIESQTYDSSNNGDEEDDGEWQHMSMRCDDIICGLCQ